MGNHRRHRGHTLGCGDGNAQAGAQARDDGIVIWAAGAFALQLGLAPDDPVGARSYYITLGVITFAGFVMTVVGCIRWWRAKRDPN